METAIAVYLNSVARLSTGDADREDLAAGRAMFNPLDLATVWFAAVQA